MRRRRKEILIWLFGSSVFLWPLIFTAEIGQRKRRESQRTKAGPSRRIRHRISGLSEGRFDRREGRWRVRKRQRQTKRKRFSWSCLGRRGMGGLTGVNSR